MPRQTQRATIPIPLGVAGVETRGDIKAILPPRLLRLENARFTVPGSLVKRPGTVPLASKAWEVDITALPGTTIRKERAITGAIGVAARGDELCLFDGRYILATNDSLSPYFTSPGSAVATGSAAILTARRKDLATLDTAGFGVDFAQSNGLLVIAETIDSAAGGTRLSFLSPDGHLIANLGLVDGGRPRCVVVNGKILVFTSRPAVNSLFLYSFSLDGGVLTNAPQVNGAVVGTTLAADVNGTNPYFDVAVSGGKVLVVYNTTTANTIKFTYVDAAGNLESAFTSQATLATPTCLGCAVDESNGHLSLIWGSASGTEAREFNADKTAFAAVATVDATASPRNVCGIWHGAVGAPATRTCRIFIEIAGAQTYLNLIRRATMTAASGAVWLRHSGLASRPWKERDDTETSIHLVVTHESTLQSTYFVMRYMTYGTLATVPTVMARVMPQTGGGLTTVASHLPQVQLTAANEWALPCFEKTRLSSSVTLGTSVTARRARVYTLRANQMPPTVTLDSMLITPSGMTTMYDGSSQAELGFLLWPENVSGASSAAAGGLVAGQTYGYRVYLESYGSRGRERSTAVPVSVTVGGGNDTVTLTIPTIAHINRGAALVVYRTAAGGTIYYRASNADNTTSGAAANGFLTNNGTVDSVTWVDKLSDAALQVNETDYLSASEVDNIAPPSCSIITAGNNRVFLAGFDDPNLIWASKLRETGDGLAFSDVLTISCDAGDGPITGLALISDVLVIFREHQIYLIGGDGPVNTGLTGEWTPPRAVSEDVGCIEPRSIVRIPQGVMFQSRKGIYLFSGDGAPAYVGAQVEAYNGETITSAVAVTSVNEVRFTLASGKTLAYDYLAGQWSVWSLGGLSACLWNDTWAYLATSAGDVYKEDPTGFLDVGANSYDLVFETAWIRFNAIQDYLRLLSARLVGAWKSAHKIVVNIAYDGEEAWVDTVYWSPALLVNFFKYGDGTYGVYGYGGGLGADLRPSGVYQFEIRPSRQRARAFKFRVSVISDGAGLLREGASVSELLLDIMTITGPKPLQSSRRATP